MHQASPPQQALDQLHRGEYAQAAQGFQHWLTQEPGQRLPHWYLGLIALLEGDTAGVDRHWRRVIQGLDPEGRQQELMRFLEQEAVAFVRAHQLGVARQICQQLIELSPHHIPAYLNLAQLLGWMEQFPEALAVLQAALQIVPGDPEVHYELAMTYKRMGQPLRSIPHLRQTLQRQPDHANAMALLDAIWSNDCVWHFPMLNDQGRNQAFQQAIERAVQPGDQVLDIGAGSGLLSLMAARAGADRVTACEFVAPIAEKAVEIVVSQGYADRIQVINKRSTDLQIPQDLPQAVDLIVSEIFSADLVSEGALGSLNHGIQQLAKPGARIIPQGATLYCGLFEGMEIWQKLAVDQVCGFDLRGFNDLSWPFRLFTQMEGQTYQFLSEIVPMARIDFSSPFQPLHQAIELQVEQSGTCHGVACWFDLFLDEQTILTSGPQTDPTKFRARHWGQMIQLLDPPLAVTPGQRVRFLLECRERLLCLWFQEASG